MQDVFGHAGKMSLRAVLVNQAKLVNCLRDAISGQMGNKIRLDRLSGVPPLLLDLEFDGFFAAVC